MITLADLELAIEKRGGEISVGGASVHRAKRDIPYADAPDGGQYTKPEEVWISSRLENGREVREWHETLSGALQACGVQP